MFNVVNLDSDVVAVCQNHPAGSYVLLFHRNEGLLGRVQVPERGQALEQRLTRSFARVADSNHSGMSRVQNPRCK